MVPARDLSSFSEELISTAQWIQDMRCGMSLPPRAIKFWPNSKVTAEQEARECSRAPNEANSPGSKDTDAVLKSMTCVGGMNYAKYRLEGVCRPNVYGKPKKVRPSTLYMGVEMGGDNAPSVRDCAHL